MTEVIGSIISFIGQWWGIIFWVIAAILALFGVEVFVERGILQKRVRDLIFLAEKEAREAALITGEQKFQWVIENGYKLLPPVLNKFISEDMFKVIVQAIYDRIKAWAEISNLTELN